MDTADVHKGPARFDLTLAVYPGPDEVDGWLEYDTDLYEEATVRRLAERFRALAEAMAGGARSDHPAAVRPRVRTGRVRPVRGLRLVGTVGHFSCTLTQLIPAGDHTSVIGLVTECDTVGNVAPLVFGLGRFCTLGTSVSEAAERAQDG